MARGWLSQTSIPHDKNVRLFDTHAGPGGVAECIYYAVPAVCIPFFSDQPQNCDDMVTSGYAVKLDHNTLSEDGLYGAIIEVLDNPKYKKTRNSIRFLSGSANGTSRKGHLLG